MRVAFETDLFSLRQNRHICYANASQCYESYIKQRQSQESGNMTDNSFQVVIQEEETIEQQLADVWPSNIKKRSQAIFNSFLQNLTYISLILLIVYLSVFIVNLLSCKDSFFAYRLQQSQTSVPLLANSHSQLSSEKARPLLREQQHLSYSVSKLARSLENEQNQDKDEVIMIATPPLDLSFPPLTPVKSTVQKAKLEENGRGEESESQGITVSEQPFQIQSKKSRQVLIEHKQSEQPKLTAAGRIQQKYSNLLSEFDSDIETLQSKIRIRDQQNQHVKQDLHGEVIHFMSMIERQNLIEEYLQNNEDSSSQFIGLALQNERFSKKETDLDKSFKKSLFKRYSVRDFEPVHTFCVVVNTFNQADSSQITRTLNSIFNQKYTDYKVVLVDQMSSDKTLDLVQGFIQEHERLADSIKVIPASKHKTPVEATLEGLLSCGKEDIAVLMSGNDELLSRQIFRLMDFLYQTKKVKAIYSDSFDLDRSKKQLKVIKSSEYDQSDKFMNLYRDLSKKYGSFFTFQSHLASSVTQNMLKDSSGEWFKFTSNEALITSILELTCSRNAYISEPVMLHQIDSQQIDLAESEEVEERQAIARKNKLNKC